ncbi:inactive receptor-like serine/threonine-protein kinase At2g40270 [Apium graveolens]|uniref:inactive receptor-like serine/threonine-protein kinase At2g40270 n=1 Tax=Apium graveolens TaxID=4045 RepID=UPI003D7963D5
MSAMWRFCDHKLVMTMILAVVLVFQLNLSFCWSLNSEGVALLRFRDRVENDPFGALSNWNSTVQGDFGPCSWFGIECSQGHVISLNLKGLCLGGTLAPEVFKLAKIKSIILRNNSFYGNLPEDIGQLRELEQLDLGYNNFSGPFTSKLGDNHSLSILLLDNNKFLGRLSPELNDLKMLSELQVDEKQLNHYGSRDSCSNIYDSWSIVHPGHIAQRKLHQVRGATEPTFNGPNEDSGFLSPSLAPFPSIAPSGLPVSSISEPPLTSFLPPFGSPSPSPILPPSPAPSSTTPPPVGVSHPGNQPASSPSPASTPSHTVKKSKHHTVMIVSGVVGGSVFLFLSALGIGLCRRHKVITVRPWATGLSGQLQKAFISGVPKLQRSELEIACEDFSNIIGSLSDGTVYKGTLSTGVEIAVTSTAVKSVEDWSKSSETQFRKKIDKLCKMNHKNFVNLIGFCEEKKPFTRMMVFEYATNGTLFEHLHIKESEHLDWRMRLRIAMGMAYCLEYMHQLNPPTAHANLQSSSVYLTEDYAAKISDFSFWNDATAGKMGSVSTELLETSVSDPESNVYNFGVILYEMITGRLPNSGGDYSFVNWATGYLSGTRKEPLGEMVDPTLASFDEEQLQKLCEVIKVCVHPDPKQRLTITQVTEILKEITAIGPDGATPRLSPLWWAELEILSTSST